MATDAAAAATALATGKKTLNGVVSHDPIADRQLMTILEKAKQVGRKTGKHGELHPRV